MSEPKKVLLVTGASRGIGAEIALQAARDGYRVALNFRGNQQLASNVAAQIEQEGGSALLLQADVGSFSDVEQMFRRLDDAYGPPDVLVNNAGVLSVFPVEQVDGENVEEMFRVNVFSAYYCAREAMRRMSTRAQGRGGTIINISSIASRLGGLGVAYAGTKGALDAFTLALAKDAGRQGVRVATVRPGLIDTDIHAAYSSREQMRERAKADVPLGRAGSPNEVARAVLWLASDEASYIHGAIIDVSGGR